MWEYDSSKLEILVSVRMLNSTELSLKLSILSISFICNSIVYVMKQKVISIFYLTVSFDYCFFTPLLLGIGLVRVFIKFSLLVWVFRKVCLWKVYYSIKFFCRYCKYFLHSLNEI